MANDDVASGSTGGGGEEVGIASGTSSPKNRMKFLISYGGKILPRPADGHLKYVGGETRVIAVPRDINFSDLMKKLTSEFEGGMLLKYQVIPEDLDMLVSVRNNEDLKHMLDEYDRHESEGIPKLRAFLFPSTPVILDNQNAHADTHAIEQRYVDAINNTFRTISNHRPSPIIANHPTFSISACSSPKCNSPDSDGLDGMSHEPNLLNSYHNSRVPIHKVHSSPSLYNLNSSPSLYNLNASHHQSSNISNHHLYQQHHHMYQQHHQHHYPQNYQSSRPPPETRSLTPALSLGRPDFGRALAGPLNQYHSNVQNVGSSNVHHNWSSHGYNMGSGNSNKHGHHDEPPSYGYRKIDRFNSLSLSPRNRILE